MSRTPGQKANRRMSMEAHELLARKEQFRDEQSATPAPSTPTNKERVLKWFNDADKIAAIKAENVVVRIGYGPEARDVAIRPLSPLQFVDAFVLIKEVLVPLVGLYEPGKPPASIAQILDSLGENVKKIPELLSLIIKRGNDVSEAWLNEHLCLTLDLQLIIPAFMEQNGLWKLFSGNAELPPATNGAAKTQTIAAAQVTPE